MTVLGILAGLSVIYLLSVYAEPQLQYKYFNS